MRVISKVFLVWIFSFTAGMYLLSCEDDVLCSGFDSSFEVTGFTLTENVFEGVFFSSNEIELLDTIRFDSVSLLVNTNFQTVASIPTTGQLFGSAMACSPPALTPLDSISSIFITENLEVEFSISNTINFNDDFDIITFDEWNGESVSTSVSNFNRIVNPVPIALQLRYKRQPEEAFPISFKVTINLTNGDSYELTSKLFYISP